MSNVMVAASAYVNGECVLLYSHEFASPRVAMECSMDAVLAALEDAPTLAVVSGSVSLSCMAQSCIYDGVAWITA